MLVDSGMIIISNDASKAIAKDMGVSKNLKYLPAIGTHPSSADTQKTAPASTSKLPREFMIIFEIEENFFFP